MRLSPFVLTGLLLFVGLSHSEAAERPNIVLIVADDMGHSDLGVAGHPLLKTPSLDRLAREGVRFTHAFTPNPICTPSRAALLTGQDCWTNGCYFFGMPIKKSSLHFATLLSKAGYETFYTGKWHNDGKPWTRGFSSGACHFAGGPPVETRQTKPWVVDHGGGNKRRAQRFSTTLITDAALEFLDKRKPGGKPFLMFVSHKSPHDPWTPPGKYASMYPPRRIAVPKNFLPRPTDQHGRPYKWFTDWHGTELRDEALMPYPRTAEGVRDVRSRYFGMVTQMDHQIGRILNKLDETRLAANTLVIFIADHGISLGAHGFSGKQTMYEEGIRLPMIMRHPRLKRGPPTNSHLVSLIDLFPTICAVAGVEIPQSVEGQSLLGLYQSKDKWSRNRIFAAFHSPEKHRMVSRAVRTTRYKYIHNLTTNENELYDLNEDPFELTNLSGNPKLESVEKQLAGELRQWRKKSEPIADTVLLDGKIITLDRRSTVAEALAIRGGKILDVGGNEKIKKYVGKQTRVIRLEGKTVIPGIIAAHCHAVGVARGTLIQPHAELLSIAEVQAWIRRRAKEIPVDRWIKVPRADITRLKERRHPTVAELDAACTTHPVIFTAARKHALNSLGLRLAGVEGESPKLPGGEIIRGANGRVRLIAGANAHLRKLMPRPEHSPEKLLAALQDVHRRYNAVGITSIFERAGGIDDFLLYRQLRDKRKLSVRMTQTFRSRFRSAQQVEQYTKKLGMTTGHGDDWVRAGPLKIAVDGGIHWGNTHLREPYGKKRIDFYVHKNPDYRGDLYYSVELMTELFRAGHRLGWQWCCHVTGDAGVDRVLDALAAVHKQHPDIAKRRFSLTHAYFPAADSIQRAAKLGVCLDTQSSLYYKDAAAIAEVYGRSWANRFIGLGDWRRGGIPTAIAGDHMVGLDPDRSMNAYNPFLMLYVAVTRKDRHGVVYGPHQKISRIEALRCITTHPAHLEFTEQRKGSLEPGKLADLAVLDRDYLTCPEEQIRRINVQMTMLDGNIVYRREESDAENQP